MHPYGDELYANLHLARLPFPASGSISNGFSRVQGGSRNEDWHAALKSTSRVGHLRLLTYVWRINVRLMFMWNQDWLNLWLRLSGE